MLIGICTRYLFTSGQTLSIEQNDQIVKVQIVINIKRTPEKQKNST